MNDRLKLHIEAFIIGVVFTILWLVASWILSLGIDAATVAFESGEKLKGIGFWALGTSGFIPVLWYMYRYIR